MSQDIIPSWSFHPNPRASSSIFLILDNLLSMQLFLCSWKTSKGNEITKDKNNIAESRKFEFSHASIIYKKS